MLTQTARKTYTIGPAKSQPSILARVARRVVLRALENVRWGCLEVQDGDARWKFGVSDADALRAVVRVQHPQFYVRILFGGTVGAGESYAGGDWDTDDLTAVIRVMVANQDALQGLDGRGSRWAKKGLEKLVHMSNANTRAGSRKNIAAHYDMSNDFFRLWLDSRMMYSSAVFTEDDMDLETASQVKLQRICNMLDLQPDEHLLEIGAGWGGMAIYAATHYGVYVTTTTISPAQFDEAQTRVKAAGLGHRVEVLLEDYRDLQGQYDKIVSVEMVEAVGDEFVDGYFQKVESLLAPAGKFVVQAITIQDQRYTQALREVDFIKKHIFPGSFIPSVSRLVNAAARTDALKLSELRDIGVDYAKTLRCWSENFNDCSEQLAIMGFDERFQRLWQFYFCYCEGGFWERAISDVQVVFSNQPIPLQRGVS